MTPPSAIVAGEPVDAAFTARFDGSEQRCVIVHPDAARPPARAAALIALHGHGSDRWQFVKNARDECRAARDAAAKWGMIFVSPDYRATTSWMGPAAETDLVQIIEGLKRRLDVDAVVLCGGSMGATAALTFAALHPDLVDGVVALNGTANLVEYDQFQDAIAASYGGTKQDVPDEYRKRSAELHAEALTMPIAITTGGRDTVVPPASALRLARRLQAMHRPVRLIHQPDGGHETSYADAAEALAFVLGRVLDENEGRTQCPD